MVKFDQLGNIDPGLPSAVEALAESLVLDVIDSAGQPFDDVVVHVLALTDGVESLPLNQLAGCISHARVLLGQHGRMTWVLPNGSRAIPLIDDPEVLAHDRRTAARLLS